jgi:hypothetical protein
MVKPYVFAVAVLLGLTQTAAATGPAGGAGVTTAIPGSIVRWQPGDPVPPGLISILTAPPSRYQPPPQPVERDIRIRKQ